MGVADARSTPARLRSLPPHLGRVHLVLDETDAAQTQLTQAVEGLRQAGTDEFIALGLLARATLHLRTQRLDAARRDLDEALEIAQRGSMRLFEADARLGFAWWHLGKGDAEAARRCVARARGIVEETGYGRRWGEVGCWRGGSDNGGRPPHPLFPLSRGGARGTPPDLPPFRIRIPGWVVAPLSPTRERGRG